MKASLAIAGSLAVWAARDDKSQARLSKITFASPRMLVRLAVVIMIELEAYAVGLRETHSIFSKPGLELRFVGA
jgi:hypothetical protein